ncbi:hypothetical protein EJB05_27497, partial [Eragrostis curvula]
MKVAVVLGAEGLGKTTLATEVLRKQQSRFDCTAHVYVVLMPSMDATLLDIARQVMPRDLLPRDDKHMATRLRVPSHKESTQIFHVCGLKEPALELVHATLTTLIFFPRYLILIDDVWRVMDWTGITCALADNDLGSRILATTQLKEKDCLLDSKILQNLLKICGGNPLALGVTAVAC